MTTPAPGPASITLTPAECRALHELIAMLSGGNPENVFDWEGHDDPADVQVRAVTKVYMAAGERVPYHLQLALEGHP